MKSMAIAGCAIATLLALTPPVSAQVGPVARSTEVEERRALAKTLSEKAYLGEIGITFQKEFVKPEWLGDCDFCGSSKAAKTRVAVSWQAAAKSGFNADAFARDVESVLVERMTASELREWLAFFDTDLGRKVHAASKPDLTNKTLEDEMRELQEFAKRLEADKQRKFAIETLVRETNAIDDTVDLIIDSVRNTIVVIASAVTSKRAGPRPEVKEMAAAVEAGRPVIRAAIAQMMVPALGNVFKDLSTSELQAYARIVSSPHAQKALRVQSAGMRYAMERQLRAIGEAFDKTHAEVKL